MIYRRQKLLLGLVEIFKRKLTNTDLQKYLFLLTRLEDEKSYHFVPYKFGCFSFQAYNDKHKLISKGFLKDSKEWVLETSQTKYKDMLTFEDNKRLWQVKKEYGELKGDDLVKHVYMQYPYFAINSTIAKRILSKSELERVEESRPINNGTILYTLGYEGKSLEEYLNILLKNGIKLLCDVRKNPLSRKYGFSKKTLKNAIESLGMEYRHIPELGIASDSRKNLNSTNDYEKLFDTYERDVLVTQSNSLKIISDLINDKQRVALTCFELLPSMCHRTRVAKAVLALGGSGIKFKELQ